MPNGPEDEGRTNPLTQTDLDDINRALERLTDARRLIEQSKLAGLDVEAFEVRRRELDDKLRRVKQAFFPGS